MASGDQSTRPRLSRRLHAALREAAENQPYIPTWPDASFRLSQMGLVVSTDGITKPCAYRPTPEGAALLAEWRAA